MVEGLREVNDYLLVWGTRNIYSNYYYTQFWHKGNFYRWSEQAIMYRKAKLFGEDRIAEDIMDADTPKECKELGDSEVFRKYEEEWIKIRERVYYEVLFDKFSVERQRCELVNTGSLHIVYATMSDSLLGIGVSEKSENATQPEKWEGINMLGNVLMRVRSVLNGQ